MPDLYLTYTLYNNFISMSMNVGFFTKKCGEKLKIAYVIAYAIAYAI